MRNPDFLLFFTLFHKHVFFYPPHRYKLQNASPDSRPALYISYQKNKQIRKPVMLIYMPPAPYQLHYAFNM